MTGIFSITSKFLISGFRFISITSCRTTCTDLLVSTQWLHDNLQQKSVKLLHSSWAGCADYHSAHIAKAICFDGKSCLDLESPYLNMMPKPEIFESYMNYLGVSKCDHIVVYDADAEYPNVPLATRLWWCMHVFGHTNVSVLDGGFMKWLKEGRPVEEGCGQEITPGSSFGVSYNPQKIATFEDVIENLQTKQSELVDTRPGEAFNAIDENGNETKIPGSLHLHSTLLVDPRNFTFKSKIEIEKLFQDAGIDKNKQIVASCRTGMLATSLLFASNLIGVDIDKLRLYDGSWFEYSQRIQKDEGTKPEGPAAAAA